MLGKGICGSTHAWCKLCRPDVVKKLSIILTNKTKSPEHTSANRVAQLKCYSNPARRAVHSASMARWWANVTPEKRRNRLTSAQHAARHTAGPSGIECILRELLLPVLLPGRRIVAEHPWHGYSMDAFVPALNLCIEADGWRHRKDPRTRRIDRRRNRQMRAAGLSVVRFWDRELEAYAVGQDLGQRFWKKIDRVISLEEVSTASVA